MFIQVAEALPVSDASIDAVVGTLVLCSVKDVNKTLQGMLFLIHCYIMVLSNLHRYEWFKVITHIRLLVTACSNLQEEHFPHSISATRIVFLVY